MVALLVQSVGQSGTNSIRSRLAALFTKLRSAAVRTVIDFRCDRKSSRLSTNQIRKYIPRVASKGAELKSRDK